MKYCNACKTDKSLNNFNKDRQKKDGFCLYCRQCASLKKRDSRQKHRESISIAKRAERLKSRYGLTTEDYNKLLEVQNHTCAICKKPETSIHNSGQIKRLAVDHCHSTGIIRGLLCTKCNQGVGYFDDKIQLLNNAISYFEKSGWSQCRVP